MKYRNHWTDGGTGITNFNPSDIRRYEKAIQQSGNTNLVIKDKPMDVEDKNQRGFFSLHYKDISKRNTQGLSSFWRIFESIK